MDSFYTANETNKLPSQLAKENSRMLKIIEKYIKFKKDLAFREHLEKECLETTDGNVTGLDSIEYDMEIMIKDIKGE